MFDPKIPFPLPLLPTDFDYNQVDILKSALRASNAIAKLNGLVLLLPNQELLVRPLLSKESVESSAIENIFTTTMELLKAETTERNKLKWPEKEEASYKDALMYGFDFIKKKGFIHTNLLVELGDIIEPSKGGIRKIPGTVTANGFWETIYTPPVWEETIRNYLRNLEDFINNSEDDIDPLIKSGVIHYQFESIHPFHDGNGRTGRILMVLYFVLTWKLDYPILFLSEYINKHRREYYSILHTTSHTGDFKDIVLFTLKAVEEQALVTAKKIIAIDKLIRKLSDTVQDERLVHCIFSNPYINIQFLSKNLNVTRQTASKYIGNLEKLWVLQSVDYGKTKLFFNQDFIDMLS